jgi:SAM-dependent methyltransferase
MKINLIRRKINAGKRETNRRCISFPVGEISKKGFSYWYWDYKDCQILKVITVAEKEIVDLGCVEGILLEKIVKSFPSQHVSGVDIIPENIEIYKKFGLPVLLGDINSTDLSDNSVDLVLLIEVVEHLNEPVRILKEIKRILKTGGKVVFLFLNDFIFGVVRLLFLRIKELLKRWMPNQFNNFINTEGFRQIRQHSLPFLLWPISLYSLHITNKN